MLVLQVVRKLLQQLLYVMSVSWKLNQANFREILFCVDINIWDMFFFFFYCNPVDFQCLNNIY